MKSSVVSKTPKIIFSNVIDGITIFCSLSQDENNCQNFIVISQKKNKCSGDSTSVLQKAQSGESIHYFNNFSFVKTMLFNNLY